MSRETRNHTLENLEIELAWLLGCRTGDTPGVAYSDAAVEKLRQEIQHVKRHPGRFESVVHESIARAKAIEEHEGEE